MFKINDIIWNVIFTNDNDKLMRSDGTISLAVTDWNDKTIYISSIPKGAYLRKIIAHELCHCFCFSYGIHIPIEQEEFMADWISLYGSELIYLLDYLMAGIKKESEGAS